VIDFAVGRVSAFLLALLFAFAPRVQADLIAQPSARLLFFTDDGTESGTPLLPGFLHDSIWSGYGVAANGDVFIAVSNHQDPTGGNVALYRYDPSADQMSLLGDIQNVSTSVGNWISGESQHKVHTFLLEHADGRLYFASQPTSTAAQVRGAHLYRLNPVSGLIEDLSKTAPFVMTQSLQVIANGSQPTATSGVFIQGYGLKGLGLNPLAPDVLYAMTNPDGHLIRHEFSTGAMEVVGASVGVNYVFHVDAAGDVYYMTQSGGSLSLLHYRAAPMTTDTLATGIPGSEVGAVVPTADGSKVYWLIADTKTVHVLDTATGSLSYLANACGTNWWRLFNMVLSPDENSLYYLSNNNSYSYVIRMDAQTGACANVLDVNALVGTRNLSFGGIGTWDRDGRYYTPVWTFQGDPLDLAMLQIDLEPPQPAPSVPAMPGLALGLLTGFLLTAGGVEAARRGATHKDLS